MKLKIEYVDIKDLKMNKKNPRKNEGAVDKVAKSITEFGFANPILIDDKNTIIAGHTRLKAASKLGLDQVPTVKLSHLTPAQANALMIADNKLNELAEWDDELLKELLHELPETLDVEALGFDLDEIEKMIGVGTSENFNEAQEDEIPEEVDPVVKLGQIWQLGEHRLMCGDSTNSIQIKKLMDGKKADMAFEDPPYNTGMTAAIQQGKAFAGGSSTWLSHMFNDKFTDEEWKKLLEGFVLNTFDCLKDDSVAYICLDWRRNHELVNEIDKYFKRSNLIVWDKMVHGLGSDYKYTHELINVCKKGKPELTTNLGEQDYQDIWHIQRKMGRDEEHATKKPIELVERALRHASKNGDSVLDLFGGSGSTLIACEKTNRKCFMMELEPHYCDVIIKRFENVTGKKAVLLQE